MDFTFSSDQEQFRDSVRSFLVKESPKAYVRQMAEHDDTGITPEVWRAITDLGWTGVLVPEEHGGLGLGIVDAVVVQEEMGRAVFPGPYFSSAILTTLAARALGMDDRLEALAAGRERGAVALDEAGTGSPLDRVRVRAEGRGNRYKLDGVKPMVMDGASADWILVPARYARWAPHVPRRTAGDHAHAEPRHHPQVRAHRVRRHARRRSRPRERPDRIVAARARRRRGVARRGADRRVGSGERAGTRLRAGARRVRQAAVEVPGDAAQVGRHAAAHRTGQGRGALRRRGRRRSRRPTASPRRRWRSPSPRKRPTT